MDIFFILFIELLIATAIFYIVLFSFIFYWHLVKTSFVVVPVVFAFDFFKTGFFIISIITIIVKFLPSFINFLNL
ncbi:MAG: hypothetical protein A2599_02250 [Candidatus Staskawiczbacteria bacterium RIFOXYD1_FULL_39_28]|uniref:Uncharacterized protein n=1 Tax=Candidatus Staskawiczbacteria bacterium RIFOXYC1_FULL_38_18 TaxID=1802229 RepID=A0A1G2JE68_9BACT|nr:MAG: hypothetical protein A2401_03265 [Candidatus Staskawiczbacteria bacterium RIFOXYC1_FULL_38_18]OGZ91889.1 MAG: hypothetical protein A2599_02250 [Candidatus Staskawiczbacteria bacterium RIFOXYD1_FULL_39_28]